MTKYFPQQPHQNESLLASFQHLKHIVDSYAINVIFYEVADTFDFYHCRRRDIGNTTAVVQ